MASYSVYAIWGLLGFVFLHQVVLRTIRHYWQFPIPGFATQFIDNPIRRRFIQNPRKIADRLELSEGMTVLEIGPGKGSYTFEVARRVSPGKVYAFDISEFVVEKLGQRSTSEGLNNIVPRVEDVFSLSLPDMSVDRVFLIACLPEIPNPENALRELYRVIRPGGYLSTSEMLFDPDYPFMKTEKEWAENVGFELVREYSGVLSYQIVWKRPTM